MTALSRDPRAADSARYPLIAILLHWIIAAAIVLQIVLSGRMEGPGTPTVFAVTQLHKSVGITILVLSLARIAWRLLNPPAPLPATLPRWDRIMARAVHVGFYVVMIGMPITGWIMVSASRIPIPTLLYGVVPWPDVPGMAHLAAPAKHMWREIGQTSHGLLADFAYVLLGLHVAGALKHQFLSEDEPVLARMAPGAVSGRWLEPRIAVIALAALGVVVFGRLVTPPPPGMAPRPAPAPVLAANPAAEPAQAPTASAPAPEASSPASAPPAKPGPVEPAKWTIEPGSTLGFATSWSGQAVQGRFERWRAEILFSPDVLDRSKVRVTIDMTSANTGDQQRDAVLPSGDWFDAQTHPKAVFTATRFEKVGADRFIAHGSLELKGVTKPVDLPFRLKINGDQATVGGTASLDRTLFGVGQGEGASIDQIPAKVDVEVALKARRG